MLANENASSRTVAWLLPDNLGTIRDVDQFNSGTNTTTVVDHLKFDSFGNITAQSNSANQPLFAFTGMLLNSETGLYYDHARWYDPHTGRFMSQDPTGFGAGDPNLYRYVANSPTNFIDPSGLRDQRVTNAAGLDAPLDLGGIDSNIVPFMNAMNSTLSAGSGSSGPDWLDDYGNGFNNLFGSGWSNMAGSWAHWAINSVGISDADLAKTGPGVLFAGTLAVSIPLGIAIFAGGELALGVGSVPVMVNTLSWPGWGWEPASPRGSSPGSRRPSVPSWARPRAARCWWVASSVRVWRPVTTPPCAWCARPVERSTR